MRTKYLLTGLGGIVAGVLLTTAAVVLAGNPGGPGQPPADTLSYTLADVYNRLHTGASGAQTGFTEPSVAPGVGTGHTLNEVMDIAPEKDDTHGAAPADVLDGRTYWGLTSGEWGPKAGTMANRGAVTIVPTTTEQAILEGYHDGDGSVAGDADLLAGNIKAGVTLFGVEGALWPGGVPKTGQTECYESFGSFDPCTCGDANCPPGQDGDLQKGVEWPEPRFTDNGDGTVMDNLTGLTWLQNANCVQGTRNWATAFSDVAQLNADGTMNGNDCGDTSNGGSHQTDWRLPNVRELHSLIHYGFFGPALPDTAGTGQHEEGDPFTGVQSEDYWSSSTDVDFAFLAWFVYLASGRVDSTDKGYGAHVWPVRGGE